MLLLLHVQVGAARRLHRQIHAFTPVYSGLGQAGLRSVS